MAKLCISKENLSFFNLNAESLENLLSTSFNRRELILIVIPDSSSLTYSSRLNNRSLNGLRKYLIEHILPKDSSKPFDIVSIPNYVW